MTEQALFFRLEEKADWLYMLNRGTDQYSAALTTVNRLQGENEFTRRTHDVLGDIYEVTLANVNGPLATYHIAVNGDDPERWAIAVVESIETADA